VLAERLGFLPVEPRETSQTKAQHDVVLELRLKQHD
jgi:hypothetical protein